MAQSARQTEAQSVMYLRRTIDYSIGEGIAIPIGTVPAGALILKPASGVHVTTAFNAGTTNEVDIGPTTNDDLWGTNLALGTTTFVPLDEAVSFVVGTTETQIIATMNFTGTTVSAGAAEVVIAFIPDNDG